MIILETSFLRALVLSLLHMVFFYLLMVFTIIAFGGSVGLLMSRGLAALV